VGVRSIALVVRDMLIVSTAGGGVGGLVALNKQTGETNWKSESFGIGDTYNSPLLVTIAGNEQVVMWHKGTLAAIDPANGKLLWNTIAISADPPALGIGDGRSFPQQLAVCRIDSRQRSLVPHDDLLVAGDRHKQRRVVGVADAEGFAFPVVSPVCLFSATSPRTPPPAVETISMSRPRQGR